MTTKVNNTVSPRLLVLEEYPNAKIVNLATVRSKSKWFVIMSDNKQLGKGQSRKGAWKSAYRNVYCHR